MNLANGKLRPKLGNVNIKAGAYAAVLCEGETSFRALHTDPARMGEAGGHAGLASEQPVLWAGELVFDATAALSAWNNVSGTYQCPEEFAAQSKLPDLLFLVFRPRGGHTRPRHRRLASRRASRWKLANPPATNIERSSHPPRQQWRP